MDDHPDIAVVIPAYQAETFLLQTVVSVTAQTVLPAEVIVVDDGSTDGTCAVLERFAEQQSPIPIELVRESHRGPGASRNTGIRAARAEWIAFLDADDLWHPEKLSTVSRAIRAHPDSNFFCHNELIRSLDGRERVSDYSDGFQAGLPLPAQLFRRNYFSTSAVVCRRDLLLRSGGFDETLASAQDYELWLRLSPELLPTFVPEVLGTYVMRSGNITSSQSWRRLANLLRVRHVHRGKSHRHQYVLTQCQALFMHVLTPVARSVRRFVTRRVREGA